MTRQDDIRRAKQALQDVRVERNRAEAICSAVGNDDLMEALGRAHVELNRARRILDNELPSYDEVEAAGHDGTLRTEQGSGPNGEFTWDDLDPYREQSKDV